ncbi:MAG: beta-lactamase family protein [Oscillospiraceae bacterium]|nr:beta-lactamase family protein [Oscillospiraceae bacterium]
MKHRPFVRLRMKARLRVMFPKLRLVGLSWALACREGLLDFQTLGTARKETGAVASPYTVYHAGPAAASVTAALLALLRDEGRLSFDDPVSRHIPEFRLKDARAARTLTLRDVMGHQTGLRDSGFLCRGRAVGPAEILRFFAETDSVCPPRQRYGYCAFGYALLGLVIERVSGTAYAELARARLFEPLGMAGAGFGTPGGYAAAGYVTLPDGTGSVTPDVPDGLWPACGLMAAPADLAAWLSFWLRKGKPLISAESISLLLQPVRGIPRRALREDVRVFSAGGWRAEDYRGHKVFTCGGAFDGFNVCLTFLPEQGLGWALLSNSGGAGRLTPLSYLFADRLLDLNRVEWLRVFRQYRQQVSLPQRELRAGLRERARDAQPLPGSPDAYAGLYRHPCGAELSLVYENGAFTAHIGGAAHRFEPISGPDFALTSAFPERYGVLYAARLSAEAVQLWLDAEEILTFSRV